MTTFECVVTHHVPLEGLVLAGVHVVPVVVARPRVRQAPSTQVRPGTPTCNHTSHPGLRDCELMFS